MLPATKTVTMTVFSQWTLAHQPALSVSPKLPWKPFQEASVSVGDTFRPAQQVSSPAASRSSSHLRSWTHSVLQSSTMAITRCSCEVLLPTCTVGIHPAIKQSYFGQKVCCFLSHRFTDVGSGIFMTLCVIKLLTEDNFALSPMPRDYMDETLLFYDLYVVLSDRVVLNALFFPASVDTNHWRPLPQTHANSWESILSHGGFSPHIPNPSPGKTCNRCGVFTNWGVG